MATYLRTRTCPCFVAVVPTFLWWKKRKKRRKKRSVFYSTGQEAGGIMLQAEIPKKGELEIGINCFQITTYSVIQSCLCNKLSVQTVSVSVEIS